MANALLDQLLAMVGETVSGDDVRLSLAQTGRWLAALPRLDAALAAARPGDLPADRLEELMTVSETPFGQLRHLKPAAQMTLTPAFWDRPSVPLDHDPLEWSQ